MIRASIVVPAYNVAEYLPRCIESLIGQTEESIEVIIVDDGSTDGMSGSIADDFAALDARVQVRHQMNAGLSAARNTGLCAATGEFLFFVDGDDWVEPDMVEAMIAECVSTDAQVAVAGAYVDFHDGDENRVSSESRLLPHGVIDSSTPIRHDLVTDNFVNLLGYAWNKVYRREWLMSLGVEFEEGLALVEDIDFNSRVLARAPRTALVSRAFAHYVQRPRPTLGNTHDETFLAKRLRAIRSTESLLATWGVDETATAERRARSSSVALWAALRSAASGTHPRDTLKRMLAQPEACALVEMARGDRKAGFRGQWATRTLSRRWYSVALLPIAVQGWLDRPRAEVQRKKQEKSEGLTLIRTLKNLIPERVKGPIVAMLRPNKAPDLETWHERKKVVVALAGFYQNLGDMALTYAQKRFIERVLPDYEVLLFPSSDAYVRMKALKRVVGPQDIITVIGGGNMDDVYPSLENARRYLIRSFPDNPIVSFPQTMSFTDTPAGKRALRRTIRTYRSHTGLSLFAREPGSLQAMQRAFSGSPVEHCPDSVLSLRDVGREQPRSGLLLSMRDDKESLLGARARSEILAIMQNKTDDLIVRDTVDVAPEECRPDTYEATLQRFWDLLRSRSVVVTDRLHGMIFCVITNTPVVVLPNSNHKIKGTYDAWLKNHPYVRYLDSFDTEALSTAIDELWNLEPDQVVRPDLSAQYEPLRQALVRAAGR